MPNLAGGLAPPNLAGGLAQPAMPNLAGGQLAHSRRARAVGGAGGRDHADQPPILRRAGLDCYLIANLFLFDWYLIANLFLFDC